MKACTLCGDLLPLVEFGPNVGAKDGRQSRCRACCRAEKKAARERNRGRTPEQLDEAFEMAPAQKACPGCGVEKPKGEFTRDSGRPTTVGQHCRPCAAKKVREHAARNPERVRANARKSYQRNYQTTREYRIKKLYSLSPEEFVVLLEKQGGVCAICRCPETGKNNNGQAVRSLAVDHCHSTGQVRGLLCAKCNQGLGHFLDNPAYLASALDYILASIEAAGGSKWIAERSAS